jgi:hypothetical protein
MCRDHFTLYECDHMRYIELEPCPSFSTTKNKCLKAPHKMINHLPSYKCRQYRRTKAKAERDEFREKNRSRFMYEV